MLINIPNGRDEIFATFGDIHDPSFEARNIIKVTMPYTLYYDKKPVTSIRCHRLAADNFVKAFHAVKDVGLAAKFIEYNGAFEMRPIRGFPKFPSLHSFGIAIDMEAYDRQIGDTVTHPLGSLKRLPDVIVKCFRDAGFFYGGDFKGRKDPMHFQLATGY